MSKGAGLLTPQDLQKISNLQVLARIVVEGFTSGLHHSPRKGVSVEFKQHRRYVAGDEIRHLDWHVFGKTDRFYVREYHHETNLRATVLLDTSGSMGYAGQGLSKHQYAKCLAACLAYLMLQQQDSVGLITFDDRLRRHVPARGRPGHMRAIVNALENSPPGGETELASVFHDAVEKISRRGFVLVISDCFGDLSALGNALAHLRHARHEVIVFQIWDPDELTFPFKQWSRFDSLEASGIGPLVDPATLRTSYLARLEEFRSELSRICRRQRIDLVPLTTDQPYADALASYLSLRKNRA